MEAKPAFWWSDDARSHHDKSRCRNCGHSVAYHAHSSKGGVHSGACSVKNCEGNQCPCRQMVKVQKPVKAQ